VGDARLYGAGGVPGSQIACKPTLSVDPSQLRTACDSIILSDDARAPFRAMAAGRAGGRIRPMPIVGRRRLRALVDASVPRVYGAALAASADPEAAEDVTHEVMTDAIAGRTQADARSLVARALLSAVRDEPHPSLAPMMIEEREVVALARLGGYTVPEIAEALDIAPAEARARMTRALRAAQVR
jgi:DNA-directed RNA polymerase specialized sigma24 family protein